MVLNIFCFNTEFWSEFARVALLSYIPFDFGVLVMFFVFSTLSPGLGALSFAKTFAEFKMVSLKRVRDL